MHIVLLHLPRRTGRDPDLWNQAADHVANLIVQKDFPDYPEGLLMNSAYENKTADWVYTQLPHDAPGRKSGLDDHSKWDDWGKDTNGLPDNTAGIEQEWREKIASAAMVSRQKGKLPGGMETIIQDILQPKLNWKDILRDKVTSVAKNDYRWNPPNKKMLHQGFIFPGISGEEIKIAAAIDTSGSISDDILAEFLGEIDGICNSYQCYTLHLFAADANIAKYWELHEMDPIPRNMPGRGGTDFRPVFEDLEKGDKEFSVLIYLTDLCGTFPDKAPDFPVIWVSTDDSKVPFGEIIQIPKS